MRTAFLLLMLVVVMAGPIAKAQQPAASAPATQPTTAPMTAEQVVADGAPGSGPAKAPGETIPPAPREYVTDEVGVLTPATVANLNGQLRQFEQATTNQIVVVVYPTMRSNLSLADYSTRLANAWGIGQAGKNNGVLLLIFTKDRKLQISVGSGLERVLPDASCTRIIENDITPAFKRGDYDGGVTAGVKAIMAATK